MDLAVKMDEEIQSMNGESFVISSPVPELNYMWERLGDFVSLSGGELKAYSQGSQIGSDSTVIVVMDGSIASTIGDEKIFSGIKVAGEIANCGDLSSVYTYTARESVIALLVDKQRFNSLRAGFPALTRLVECCNNRERAALKDFEAIRSFPGPDRIRMVVDHLRTKVFHLKEGQSAVISKQEISDIAQLSSRQASRGFRALDNSDHSARVYHRAVQI